MRNLKLIALCRQLGISEREMKQARRAFVEDLKAERRAS